MNFIEKKAILVVSFGTSHENTRAVTIDAIESEIASAFPDFAIYRAWTSGMIIRKILKRDHVKIFTVSEAMEQMRADGITDVIIQPTHVINGIENDLMKEHALSFRDAFRSIRFGTPLLTSEADNRAVIAAVTDAIYAALDYQFKEMGYPNIFVGTVEAYPDMDTLLRLVDQTHPEQIYLAPFMIVAGDHAVNDMAGEDEESWQSQFQSLGYPVTCILKGLGEYEAIRKIFLQHIEDALAEA
ncbi:MAG: sirohydrochlorin cobaltochelatase [Lachnospiraceae bacterium]|nr:sirohydrochlorin cobaltochelatase [Lachnospiraceae bacterium]